MNAPNPPSREAAPVVAIESLGAQGDGIAQHEGCAIFVPFTLPGDRVRLRLGERRGEGRAATVLERLGAGEGRIDPACRHFGTCGGCQLQHLEPARYRAWKSDLLRTALERRGLDPDPVRPLVAVAPGRRRRARLAALRKGGRLRVGFHERASHRVLDLAECPLLTPMLQAALPAFRAIADAVLEEGGSASLEVAETAGGIDLLIEQRGRPPGAGARAAIAGIAGEHRLMRVSWTAPGGGEPEPLLQLGTPQVAFGGVAVDLPPGAFLQPSREGEAALRAAVEEAAEGRRRVADLFAGCGSFSLPLAKLAAVHAVEGDRAAVAALAAAAKRAGLGQRLTTERRDLDRSPLQPAELARFDAVVFDPPRAGAAAQSRALAASGIARVVALSCNPASFARDARLLADGGMTLDWALPVDQFPWSPHLELAACFSR